jgi:hypothetical protein
VQGGFVIWKNLLTAVLVISGMGIAFCLLNLWIGTFKTISAHDFIIGAFLVIAWSMGAAGSDELSRCGHRKVCRILYRYSLISLVIPLVVIGVGLLYRAWWSNLFILSASPFWVLVVAPFPVALYLSRKQKKSASQPTGANVS